MSNFCKQCGKEIPEGRKFCNSSCAAKYNNKHRTRKPWVRVKIVKNTKERFCKYCGKKLSTGERTCCSECRRYVQNLKACKKFSFQGTPKEQFYQLLDYLCRLYFDEKQSLIQISEGTGLNQTSLRRIFQKGKVHLRNLSEGTRNAVEQGRLCLRTDSVHFHTGIHVSWQNQECKYRSSWELKYMKYLDSKKIPYLYEFRYFRYYNTAEGKERLACPDFCLPETKEIVELKSTYTIRGQVQMLRDKFQAYRNAGFKPVLLLNWNKVDIDDPRLDALDC